MPLRSFITNNILLIVATKYVLQQFHAVEISERRLHITERKLRKQN